MFYEIQAMLGYLFRANLSRLVMLNFVGECWELLVSL